MLFWRLQARVLKLNVLRASSTQKDWKKIVVIVFLELRNMFLKNLKISLGKM